MESDNFIRACKTVRETEHVRVIIAVIALRSQQMSFEEQVEFFEICADRLDEICGVKKEF